MSINTINIKEVNITALHDGLYKPVRLHFDLLSLCGEKTTVGGEGS